MKPSLGKGAPIDIDRLIETRLLIQANSGAGKSWAIRRLLEQTHGHVQHILLDVESEFHTLREQFDYVLAGPKGDCVADIKSATLLARRLLELNVSAIVDIYELGIQRKLFIKRFLDALINSPRELWHPVLVIVDEAHKFCPEAGQAESASAVIDLMTLGRKRGFCGVLATQRISKLHKDAAAEANNKLIGRSALDIDMKRAAAELGFTSREDMHSLRTLDAGQFYMFGPALSTEVKLIQVGDVKTTHLRAGQRALPPSPPNASIKKILHQLADLPHEAEEEARTVSEWRTKCKVLEAELRKAKSNDKPKTEIKTVEKPVIKEPQLKRLEALGTQIGKANDKALEGAKLLTEAMVFLRKPVVFATPPNPVERRAVVQRQTPIERREPKPELRERVETNGVIPEGERTVLRAAIQFPHGLIKNRLAVLTGYKRSTRDAYVSRLREKGYVTQDRGGMIYPTESGRLALPDAEPLPVGEALRDYWERELPSGERDVLRILIERYPEPIERVAIDELTGFKRSTRDAYLSRLAAKELVVDEGRGLVKASPILFE